MIRVVLTSGGYDPLHIGHIRLFQAAALLGDHLYVGVNSDEWLIRKKGKPFMSFDERREIVAGIRGVYDVWGFDDKDGTACDFVEKVIYHCLDETPYSLIDFKFIFAKGGDRQPNNMPYKELELCKQYGVEIVYGVGGDKIQSSSLLLERNKT